MAAGSTYTPIATTTLGSATNSVTFSSISQSYTDLVLVSNYGSTSTNQTIEMRFNGDSSGSTSYSWTWIFGDGSSATSTRASNDNRIPFGLIGLTLQTTVNNSIWQFMNYSNTTTNKTAIGRYNSVDRALAGVVGLYRNTSAISSISVFTQSGNFNAGSTFTLYGIAAA